MTVSKRILQDVSHEQKDTWSLTRSWRAWRRIVPSNAWIHFSRSSASRAARAEHPQQNPLDTQHTHKEGGVEGQQWTRPTAAQLNIATEVTDDQGSAVLLLLSRRHRERELRTKLDQCHTPTPNHIHVLICGTHSHTISLKAETAVWPKHLSYNLPVLWRQRTPTSTLLQ